MQTIYQLGAASNVAITAQKRLVRPVYAQTQGFPYAATIDPYLRTSTVGGILGTIRVPTAGDSVGTVPTGGLGAAPFDITSTIVTYQGSIMPGTVMAFSNNQYSSGGTNVESVSVHPGSHTSDTTVQPAGLLGQWLGGTFDNLGQTSQVGIWMGPDSTYDILQPAWDYTNISSAVTSNTGNAQVLLFAGNQAANAGLLTSSAGVTGYSAGVTVPVARVIAMLSNAVLRVQMLV